MPAVSRWFIKLGIVYFAFSLLLAMAAAWNTTWYFSEIVNAARPVFYHTLMVGWITQIIFGVSIWMFPRLSRENPRGADWLNWLVLVTLNAGLLLRVIAEPLHALHPGFLAGIFLVVSAVLQLLAGGAYVATIWGRVKEK